MSIRVKYINGNIPIEINDNDRDNIVITVSGKYPQIKTIKGRGFKFNKDKQIICICSIGDYRQKIIELGKLLFDIEFKSLLVEEAVEEAINDSENSGFNSKSRKKRDVKSDKLEDDGADKEG